MFAGDIGKYFLAYFEYLFLTHISIGSLLRSDCAENWTFVFPLTRIATSLSPWYRKASEDFLSPDALRPDHHRIPRMGVYQYSMACPSTKCVSRQHTYRKVNSNSFGSPQPASHFGAREPSTATLGTRHRMAKTNTGYKLLSSLRRPGRIKFPSARCPQSLWATILIPIQSISRHRRKVSL